MSYFTSSSAGQDRAVIYGRIAIFIAFLATISLLVRLLSSCSLGYDFSDEAYYLNLIAAPKDFIPSISRFGYIYHPLYLLLDGSIAALRQANVIISFFLAALTCASLLHALAMETGVSCIWRSPEAIGFSFVAGGPAILILLLGSAWWLPTPSYLSLTFQALLICSIGFCLAENRLAIASVIGWAAIGIGGVLTFMAKPPSGVALAVVVISALALAGRLYWRGLAIAVGVASIAMLAQAFVIDGSIRTFIQDMQAGAEVFALLSAGHTLKDILRIDFFDLGIVEKTILALTTLTIVALVLLGSLADRIGKRVAMITTIALAVFGTALAYRVFSITFAFKTYQGVQFLALLLAGVLGRIALQGGKWIGPITRRRIALAVFFAMLPYAFAFGSNFNYWRTGAAAAVFWMLAAIVLLAPGTLASRSRLSLLPIVVVTMVMTIVFLDHGMTHPYRQTAALSESNTPVRFLNSGAKLRITPDFAMYIDALQNIAKSAGFKVRDPVIDLTGHYPGALFAIGAKPAAAAWIVGGYPGSDRVAAFELQTTSCSTVAAAWILVEPMGQRRLSPEVLRGSGIDVARDYEIVGLINSPRGTYPDSYKQQFLRPKRSFQEALVTCEAARLHKQESDRGGGR